MPSPSIFRTALVLSVVAGLLCAAETALGCPTCQEALGGGAANVARGYFWSILFMLSMPFLIFGTLSLYFYLLVRAARLRKAHESAEQPPASTVAGNMAAAK